MKSNVKKLTVFLLAALLLLCTACGEMEQKAASDTYVPGQSTETGYCSEWIGLQWMPPGNMVMLSDEDLQEIMYSGLESTYGEDADEVAAQLEKSTVYEMMCSSVFGMPNVIVLTEKPVIKSITAEQYISALSESLNSMGYTEVGTGEQELAGEQYTTVIFELSAGGVDMKQMYLARKKDGRMIGITITYMTDEDRDALLECFTAYDGEADE